MGLTYGFCVTTWSGARLQQTIAHLPKDARVLVVDTSQHQWSLAKGWNYGIRRLLWQEGFDAAVVLNDDVILRSDTADLLVGALPDRPEWTEREILLISARHAAPSDARTNEPDWAVLNTAESRHQPGPDFACYAVDRRLFECVGEFDERFTPCWHEDNDMHRRIQLAGYEAGAYAPFWHLLNGTIRSDPERRVMAENGGFQQSKAAYIAKWGGYLGEETVTVPVAQPV